MLDAALAYARKGWPVFPCHPRTKQPLVKQGFKVATTDERTIREWWGSTPEALIACPMGERSGVFVVDLDIGTPPLIEGIAYLHRFSQHVGGLPHTAIAETASGGIHVYFAYDPARPVPRKIRACPELEIAQPPGPDGKPALLPNGKRAKNAGVDVLGGEAGVGSGGYAILPPSRRADGKEWTWLHEPKDGVAAAPEAVMRLALKDAGEGPASGESATADSARPRSSKRGDLDERQRRYALRAFDEEVKRVSSAAPGTRNDTLFKAAAALGSLVAAGALSELVVNAALEEAAKECGLWKDDGAKSARATIASGLDAGKKKPRTLPVGDSGGTRSPSPRASGNSSGSQSSREDKRGSNARQQSSSGGEPPDDGIDPAVLERLADEPLNDLGNARRLIGHFGAALLNVREVGWHAWTGTHWEAEGGDEAAKRFAHITGERIALEAKHLVHTQAELEAIEAAEKLTGEDRALAGGAAPSRTAPPLVGADEDAAAQKRRLEVLRILQDADAARRALGTRKANRRKFSIASGNGGRIEAMVKQALPYITVPPDAVDADPLAINVQNGTLRLVKEKVPDPERPEKTLVQWRVELHPHRREDRITKMMPAFYDKGATAERWDAFMKRFQPTEAVRRFLQQYHGYALTGLMGLQIFVFNYGTGANGKSTFMEALARLQGPFAQVLPAEALAGDAQRRGDQATPEFARLPGARLVRAAELPRGQSFKEPTIKMLTGGEPMLVRHLHHRFFEFRPTFKAIGSGNDKPDIRGVDEGIWRRMRFVPWPVTIPEKERRPMEAVLKAFEAERSGILNWLLEGLLDYLHNGLVTPEEITSATADFRADMDPVGEFLAACVEKIAGAKVTAREMYLAYTAWCHANSVRPYSERRFSEIMATKGFAKARGRIREYLDVRLNDVPKDPERSGPEEPAWVKGGAPMDI